MNTYWASDEDISYRHMTVYANGARPGGSFTPPLYIDREVSLSKADILTIRTNLQNLASSGRAPSSKSGVSKDGRPVGFEDSFCSFLDAFVATVPSEGETLIFDSEAQIVALEGNFPAFHPFVYMSGGFLPEVSDDNMQIVINDVLAWKFYKSYDVTGNRILLWGQEFTIIGVVSEAGDDLALKAGTKAPRAYVYFQAMESYAPLVSPDADTSASDLLHQEQTSERPVTAVLCYEAMLPEVVQGVACNDFSSSISSYNPSEPNFYLLSNTGRFTLTESMKYAFPLGQKDAFLDDFELPFWEKTALLTSAHLAVLEAVFAAGLVLTLIGSSMLLLRRGKLSRK